MYVKTTVDLPLLKCMLKLLDPRSLMWDMHVARTDSQRPAAGRAGRIGEAGEVAAAISRLSDPPWGGSERREKLLRGGSPEALCRARGPG